MTLTIICQQCKCPYEYSIPVFSSSRRRFCKDCAAKRKKMCIVFSNSRLSTGNPTGRPLGSVKEGIACKNVMVWDEPGQGHVL